MEKRRKLDFLFNPSSVAIIGASRKYQQISGRIFKYFLTYGYKGEIFPVNPNYNTLKGIKCYPSLENVPGSVDLALILRPVNYVLDIIRSCIKNNVKSCVIFSSGFGETGDKGKMMENEIVHLTKNSKLTILGPNCLGFVNLHDRVPATFGGSLENENNMISGNVAFLSQGGAFSNLYFSVAQKARTGFSYWIATGNEIDVSYSDCLQYLIEDERTKVIACFIEGLRDGKRFIEIATEGVEKGKKIIAIKIGKSNVGKKASLSHTGAMGGSDQVYTEAFRKSGVIRVDSIEEIIDSVFMFSRNLVPDGDKVGIITITGGGGILMADKCEELGLKVPPLKGKTKEEMLNIVPIYGSAMNPVDLTGQLINDISSVKRSLKILLYCSYIDIIVVFLGMLKNFANELIQDIIEIGQQKKKPVCVVWIDPPNGAIRTFQKHDIPSFEDPIRCIKAIAILTKYANNLRSREKLARTITRNHIIPKKFSYLRDSSEINQILSRFKTKRKILSEYESKRLLFSYGIPITKEKLAYSPEDAVEIAEEIGYPVVLKVDSRKIAHKTEINGIKLNVQTPKEVFDTYPKIISKMEKSSSDTSERAVLVQEMVFESFETILGVKNDSVFGPTLLFGVGGIHTEILNDYSMRIAPLLRGDAEAMIREIRGIQILEGFRGKAGRDINAIVDILLKLSQLAVELEDKVVEVDINPLFVFPSGKGAKVGDALIILT
jgi:acetate---CoA ligase (ADP-forming)